MYGMYGILIEGNRGLRGLSDIESSKRYSAKVKLSHFQTYQLAAGVFIHYCASDVALR